MVICQQFQEILSFTNKAGWAICPKCHRILQTIWLPPGGGGTSTHNKWGCAILTKKVVPKNLGTYLKLRPKTPGTYLKLRPKNPGTQNARLSFYMRKHTTHIRKSLISTPHFSFTYFIKGFYYLTFVLSCLCR